MLGKCTRILMLKWAGLFGILGWLSYSIFYAAVGRLPSGEQLRIHVASSTNTPVVLTRLIDPVVVMVAVALLAWAIFDLEPIVKRWGTGRHDSRDGAAWGVATGMFLGICGSIIIAITGFIGLAIGTVVCSAIILGAGRGDDGKTAVWRVFGVEVIAVVTILALNTLMQGAVAGTIYAFSALTLAALTHFGLWGVCLGLHKAADPVGNFMLSCPNDK